MQNFLVTGGLGFIGSHFVVNQIKKGNLVVNVDKVTYAANHDNVKEVVENENYHFVKADINSTDLIHNLLIDYKIDYVVNFAAESHVDNSIKSADEFIQTNINGTFSMLQAAKNYYQDLQGQKKDDFRFLHVSTDEVYGSLQDGDPAFTEENKYLPNSPYSSSKAASDHLVRAWNETYKLPTIITNCSNNYGANQHEEKLIPKMITNALKGEDLTIYGNGKNIRDWIYVEDHCHGIELALTKGRVSETYCLGGECEMRNNEIVDKICEILDNLKPKSDGSSYKSQIKFIEDRQGHDYRYAISNAKSKKELGFEVSKSFTDNLTGIIEKFL